MSPSDNRKPASSLEETAKAGIESLAMLVEQRDSAQRELMGWKDEAVSNRARLAEVERACAQYKHERDHYQRQATTLEANLANIRTLIDKSVTDARDAAYTGRAAPAQPQEPAMSADDQARLEDLAKRLAPQPQIEAPREQ